MHDSFGRRDRRLRCGLFDRCGRFVGCHCRGRTPHLVPKKIKAKGKLAKVVARFFGLIQRHESRDAAGNAKQQQPDSHKNEKGFDRILLLFLIKRTSGFEVRINATPSALKPESQTADSIV